MDFLRRRFDEVRPKGPDARASRRTVFLWLLFLGMALVPFVTSSGYWITVLTTLLVNLVFVLGLNYMLGLAGLLNLGYGAFVGVGAYTFAIVMTDWGISFWPATLLALFVAVVAGIGVAIPTLRLSKVYLGIVTLAFGEIFVLVVLNLDDLTGGAVGVAGIGRPSLFGIEFDEAWSFYFFVLIVATLLVIMASRIERSRYGRALKFLREDEGAAEACGIDTTRTRLLAFTVGAAYAALGGVLVASQFRAISPNIFGIELTILVLTMLVVGGAGSVAGAVAGTAIFTLVPELFRDLNEYRFVFYGGALALFMVLRPEGLIPASRRPSLEEPEGTASAFEPPMASPSSASPLLEVHNVTKRFGGLVAIRDLDFRVTMPEIVSIIGPNGAGKTTLADIVAGAQQPTSGEVMLHGQAATRWRPSRRARSGVARTFQNIRLFPELTALENVAAGRHSHTTASLLGSVVRLASQRREEAEVARQARGWLWFIGDDLFARRNDIAEVLPYGLQKRLEIARALSSEPDVLILDEPAAGLSSGEKDTLAELIYRIRSLGIAVVLIEHDMRLVMSISDRVVVLNNGEIIAEDSPEEVQIHEQVIAAYLGRDVEHVH